MGSVLRTEARPLPGTSTAGGRGSGAGSHHQLPQPQALRSVLGTYCPVLGARPGQGCGQGAGLAQVSSGLREVGGQVDKPAAARAPCPGEPTRAPGALALCGLFLRCPLSCPHSAEHPQTRSWLCQEVLSPSSLPACQVLHFSSGHRLQEALHDAQALVPFPHALHVLRSLAGLCATPPGSSPGLRLQPPCPRNMLLQKALAERAPGSRQTLK